MKSTAVVTNNLILELTRKCNLKCAHCERGNAQNKRMDKQTMGKIFETFDDAGSLQFVGGEISQDLPAIDNLIGELNDKNIKVHASTIVTNATNITDEFIKLLKELKKYIVAHTDDFIANEEDAKGFCVSKNDLTKPMPPVQIIVSLDKYHLQAYEQAGLSKKDVKDCIDLLARYFPVSIEKICNYSIYNEGRATKLNKAFKVKPISNKYAFAYGKEVAKDGRDFLMIQPGIAFSHCGQVIDWDRTYDYTDQHAIGNINEEDFLKIMRKLVDLKKAKQYYSIDKTYEAGSRIAHMANTTTKELKRSEKFAKRHGIPFDYKYFNESQHFYEELF